MLDFLKNIVNGDPAAQRAALEVELLAVQAELDSVRAAHGAALLDGKPGEGGKGR
jgi:hypothetical protein